MRELEHDVSLWHHVRDNRPPVGESPLQASTWVVTVDFRFIKFDRFKRRLDRSSVPICVHPTTFVQMLQFWIPRNQEFEEAVVGSLRLPFLFQRFDPKAEQVTVDILQVMSRFSNLKDIDEELATKILVNDALRDRMLRTRDEDTRLELVREVLIDELDELRVELKSAREEAGTLARQAEREKAQSKGTEHELKVRCQETDAARAQLRGEQEKAGGLEDRLKQLEALNASREERDEINKSRRQFLLLGIVAPVCLIVLISVFAGLLITSQSDLPAWVGSLVMLALLLGCWMFAVTRIGANRRYVRDWMPFRLLHGTARFLAFALIGTGIFGGIVSTILYNAGSDALHASEPTATVAPSKPPAE
jgi:hypothetical protein